MRPRWTINYLPILFTITFLLFCCKPENNLTDIKLAGADPVNVLWYKQNDNDEAHQIR